MYDPGPGGGGKNGRAGAISLADRSALLWKAEQSSGRSLEALRSWRRQNNEALRFIPSGPVLGASVSYRSALVGTKPADRSASLLAIATGKALSALALNFTHGPQKGERFVPRNLFPAKRFRLNNQTEALRSRHRQNDEALSEFGPAAANKSQGQEGSASLRLGCALPFGAAGRSASLGLGPSYGL